MLWFAMQCYAMARHVMYAMLRYAMARLCFGRAIQTHVRGSDQPRWNVLRLPGRASQKMNAVAAAKDVAVAVRPASRRRR